RVAACGLARNDGSQAFVSLSVSVVRCYCAIYPPSTGIARPVTNDAESEQSHTAASAISSGLPKRPLGCALTILGIICGKRSAPFISIGVSIGPGQTAFTR